MQMIGHHLQRHYFHLRMMATYGLPYLCYCLSQWRQLDGSFFQKNDDDDTDDTDDTDLFLSSFSEKKYSL